MSTNHRKQKESIVLNGKIARLRFILRRAFLVGYVRRADLVAAFGVSGATATADLNEAAQAWPGYLRYEPSRGVFPQAFASPPAEASSSTFMALLQRGASLQEMGLTKYEPVVAHTTPRFVYQGPQDRQLVLLLLKACVTRDPLELEYVGMRLGDGKKVRIVLPLGMELLGQQWRLIACDVDARIRRVQPEQKVFVLARILNAQICLPLHGKRLKSHDGKPLDAKGLAIDTLQKAYVVKPNRRLSGDQLEAVVREFSLERSGEVFIIRMPQRNVVEFERDYCSPASYSNPHLLDYISPVFESITAYVNA